MHHAVTGTTRGGSFQFTSIHLSSIVLSAGECPALVRDGYGVGVARADGRNAHPLQGRRQPGHSLAVAGRQAPHHPPLPDEGGERKTNGSARVVARARGVGIWVGVSMKVCAALKNVETYAVTLRRQDRIRTHSSVGQNKKNNDLPV